MELLTPAEASRELRTSYPTVKQWIYSGKIRSVKTPGGHHRIPRSEIERLTRVASKAGGKSRRTAGPTGLDAISGRNKLRGTVTKVEIDGLLAQVTMDVCSQTIVAIITRNSCEQLGLKPGVTAFALMKATEVMIIRG